MNGPARAPPKENDIFSSQNKMIAARNSCVPCVCVYGKRVCTRKSEVECTNQGLDLLIVRLAPNDAFIKAFEGWARKSRLSQRKRQMPRHTTYYSVSMALWPSCPKSRTASLKTRISKGSGPLCCKVYLYGRTFCPCKGLHETARPKREGPLRCTTTAHWRASRPSTRCEWRNKNKARRRLARGACIRYEGRRPRLDFSHSSQAAHGCRATRHCDAPL